MAFEGKGTVLGGKSGKESPERIGRIRWEKCLEREIYDGICGIMKDRL